MPPSTNAVDAVRRLRCAGAAGAVACAVAAACAGRAAKSEAARKAQAAPAARMPTANALMLFMIGPSSRLVADTKRGRHAPRLRLKRISRVRQLIFDLRLHAAGPPMYVGVQHPQATTFFGTTANTHGHPKIGNRCATNPKRPQRPLVPPWRSEQNTKRRPPAGMPDLDPKTLRVC